MSVLERVQDVQGRLAQAEQHRAKLLDERNSLVRELRAEGHSQTATGALLGISNQRVSQIERATS